MQTLIYVIVFVAVICGSLVASNYFDNKCLEKGGYIVENVPLPIWNKCFYKEMNQ